MVSSSCKFFDPWCILAGGSRPLGVALRTDRCQTAARIVQISARIRRNNRLQLVDAQRYVKVLHAAFRGTVLAPVRCRLIMQNVLKFICLCALAFGSVQTGFAVTNSISCDYLSISNACATAHDGDVILIQPGDCVIPNEIDINRNVSFTISGSGTNATTLRSYSGDRQVIWVQSNSTNVFTICNLNCVGTSDNSSGFLVFGSSASTWQGPFHVYNIQMTNLVYRGISAGFGNAYGLIDHCYMKSQGGNPQFLDFEGASYGSWTNANPIGTSKVVCVEDCYLDNGNNYGNGFFDAYTGAQFVFRHNTCIGWSAAGVHGYDSSDISARTWEVYNNVFTNCNGADVLNFRGGTGVVFSNKVYGTVSSFAFLVYYRSCPFDHTYASVSGYLLTGVPGQGYDIGFAGIQKQGGFDESLLGNPVNGQMLSIGFTHYYFVTSLSGATFNMWDSSGYGGGAVLIGATVAQTMTNLYRAVNLDPTGWGTVYTNAYALPMYVGHEFLAIGCTATDLILTNALDGNTDQYGYPANQQPGVVTSYPMTTTNFVNHQVVWPCYAWSNTVNGVVQSFTLGDNNANCNYYITNLLKPGRDYFNDVTPSPATYTPLVYPHPLQALESGVSVSGSPAPSQLSPPTNLKANGT